MSCPIPSLVYSCNTSFALSTTWDTRELVEKINKVFDELKCQEEKQQ